jgi:hypothetical protein
MTEAAMAPHDSAQIVERMLRRVRPWLLSLVGDALRESAETSAESAEDEESYIRDRALAQITTYRKRASARRGEPVNPKSVAGAGRGKKAK